MNKQASADDANMFRVFLETTYPDLYNQLPDSVFFSDNIFSVTQPNNMTEMAGR
ncbi:MAG: hypothetical protein HY305_05630 [Sphingobacteriales bacterium]|nr:hypothetical protein [Sphingobacteriales bacterium]